jgi:hypothetical protein
MNMDFIPADWAECVTAVEYVPLRIEGQILHLADLCVGIGPGALLTRSIRRSTERRIFRNDQFLINKMWYNERFQKSGKTRKKNDLEGK